MLRRLALVRLPVLCLVRVHLLVRVHALGLCRWKSTRRLVVALPWRPCAPDEKKKKALVVRVLRVL